MYRNIAKTKELSIELRTVLINHTITESMKHISLCLFIKKGTGSKKFCIKLVRCRGVFSSIRSMRTRQG